MEENRDLRHEESIVENVETEEDVYDRIQSLTAEVNQMEAMIAENIRLIAEGDDIEGRTYLKNHLEMEVRKKKAEIAKLNKSIEG